jgi:glycosyltransferase involved in cell wall biosynthesis
MKPEISTIIITKNEQRTIRRCLASVTSFSKEIIVVDSGSTDSTVEIAKEFTDNIFTHPWSGYTPQKQFAISKASNNWIFWIDADEEVPAELQKEIAICSFDKNGYAVPRLVYYLGKWIRHCGWYPDYVVRLFDKRCGTFTNSMVHESVTINGTTDHFKSPLHHYSYRSLSHHCEKMNSFTSLHAEQFKNKRSGTGILSLFLKPIFYFFKSYVIRKGFLDGIPGLAVCMMGSFYTFLKYMKRWELQNITTDSTQSGEAT